MDATEVTGVLREYELGRVSSVNLLHAGDARAPKAVVECARGRLLLKRRAPGRDDPFRVAFQHEAQLALQRAASPVAPLIGTRDDENSMVQRDGAVYELMGMLGGDPAPRTEDGARAGGRTLGRMHAIWHTAPSRWEGAAPRTAPMRADSPDTALTEQLVRARGALRANPGPGGKPRTVHGDWHPGNLLMRAGEVVGVIDFDRTRLGSPEEDVAQGAAQFGLGADSLRRANAGDAIGLSLARVDAFWAGYLESADGDAVGSIVAARAAGLMAWRLGEEAAELAHAGADDPGLTGMIAGVCGWILDHAEEINARFTVPSTPQNAPGGAGRDLG